MAAAKKSPTKKAAKASTDADATGDEGAAPAQPRRPLVRNVSINGVWYGPAWGNAADYPDDGHDGRDELFEG